MDRKLKADMFIRQNNDEGLNGRFNPLRWVKDRHPKGGGGVGRLARLMQ